MAVEVKVNAGVRCRPLIPKETWCREETLDLFKESRNTLTTPKNTYKFNDSFGPECSQDQVFERIGQPMIDRVCQGYNGTILAYGQTGTGKTYTMGTSTDTISENTGILSKALQTLYANANDIKIRVIEIYKEDAFDLLADPPTKLSITGGLRGIGATIKRAWSLDEGRDIIKRALKNRKVGATEKNLTSSRSHVIVTLYSTKILGTNFHTSKLNLVDLAGSEKLSRNETQRCEGVAINSGLLHLLRVVDSLSKNSTYIPYRDSKLTFILQDSLNLNNFITLIACINAVKSNIEETEKTLMFASKFGGIEVTPVIMSNYGTPYKTPQRFPNKTFCTSDSFKKPLAPLNRTVATPESWSTKRREETQVFGTPMLEYRKGGFSNSSQIDSTRESAGTDLLNLSNVSTSTTFTECTRSPPPGNNAIDVPVTPFNFNALIKAAVEATVKATEKRMTQMFTKKLKELSRKGTSLNLRFESADDSLNTSENDTSQSDGSLLQNTVLGPNDSQQENTPTPSSASRDANTEPTPVFKIPASAPRRSSRFSLKRQTHENEIYMSDISDITDQDVDIVPGTVFNKIPEIAPRRSARFSLKRQTHAKGNLTSDFSDVSNNTSKGQDTDSEREGVFKIPGNAPRRSARFSIKKQAIARGINTSGFSDNSGGDGDDDSHQVEAEFKMPVTRRSMRLSIMKLKPLRENPDESDCAPIKRARKHDFAAPDVPVNTEIRAKRILKILQSGSVKELAMLPTVGQKTAALIISDRELYGPLKNVNEFERIRGLTKNQAKRFLWANSLM